MDENRQESFLTLYKGEQGRYEEKKSVFLGDACHVSSEDEALSFVEKIRKKYYDARHHCFAYRIGVQNPKLRASDDGEPSGTGGRPILDVLTGAELTDVVLVVTRYFGGTLLGTGGLVRAYTAAAKDCIEKSTLVRKTYCACVRMRMPYTELGKLQYLLAQESVPILSTDYADTVTLEILVPSSQETSLIRKITERTAGKIQPEILSRDWYAEINGKFSAEHT